MQTTTFTSLFDLVSALAGVEFTPLEQSKVVSLINRRLYEAYSASNAWPRYSAVGEARAIVSGVVPFTESGKTTIADFLRIHKSLPFSQMSAVEYEFYVDSAGAHILNTADSSATSLYVTYKSVWDGPYDISSTNVPLEHYYFAAHAAYADFLRMDKQVDKAMAEEQVAAGYLAMEVAKAESQRNNNIVSRRISTHVSRQFRN